MIRCDTAAIPIQRKKCCSRRGTSAVELAVVLPVVIILLLGAIEVGRAVSVQHALTKAARAGCRVYCVADNTAEQAEAAVDAALASSGYGNYRITWDPPTSEEIDTDLEPVTVIISIDYEDVAWGPPWFMAGRSVTGTTVMPADTGR